MRHSEIGVDHRLVLLHLVRRAVGDLHAVVEHRHRFGVALLGEQGLVVIFALAGGFYAALAGFGLADITRTLSYPVRDAWLARSINPRVRATVLSMNSQVKSFGEIAGGPALGFVGLHASLRAALYGAAGVMMPARA